MPSQITVSPKICVEESWTLRSDPPSVRVLCVSIQPDKHTEQTKENVKPGEEQKEYVLIGLNAGKGSFEMRMGFDQWKPIDQATFDRLKPAYNNARKGPNYIDVDFVTSVSVSNSRIAQMLNEVMDVENLKFDNWRFIVLDYNTLHNKANVQEVEFVCHQSDTDTWHKANDKSNFTLRLGEMFKHQIDLARDLGLDLKKFQLFQEYDVKLHQRVIKLCVGVCTDELGARIEIYCHASRALRLHWGGSKYADGRDWQRVSTKHVKHLPGYTNIVIDQKAMQTRFQFARPDVAIQLCVIEVDRAGVPEFLTFVLKEEDAPVWLNNNGRDFVVSIPQRDEWVQAKEEALRIEQEQRAAAEAARLADVRRWESACESFREDRACREQVADISFSNWRIQDDMGEIDCSVYTEDEGSRKNIVLLIDALSRVDLTLHWGCVGVGGEIQRRRDGSQWICPGPHLRPKGTVVIDPNQSVQTPFDKIAKFRYQLKIIFPATAAPVTDPGECGLKAEFGGVVFVLKEQDGNRWFKAQDGRDILIRLTTSQSAKWGGPHKALVDRIVEAEVEWDHMTLMHRYNLCNELISQHYTEAMRATTAEEIDLEHSYWAWIYTWNRFSFLCWLDWQRRYNTKPRDLSHACESLSCKVAAFWKDLPKFRVWLRMTLTTMGRGGSAGQAIRDRILDIMHKHKIPETAGNFYEQWHQKLHNNTTRDDIGICKAVIRYLSTNGDMSAYWDELHRHGITRETLAGYDRAITLEPFLVNCDRGSLIYDLKQYLDILQEVHDALDLHKSAQRVKHVLKGDASNLIDHIIWEAGQAIPSDFEGVAGRLNRVYRVRRSIIESLVDSNYNAAIIRDMLLLDSALETQQSILMQSGPSSSDVAHWVYLLIDFIDIVSRHDPENQEWKALATDWSSLGTAAAQSRYSSDGRINALLLKALVDRATRAVGDATDLFQTKLGEPSLFLGLQVGVEKNKLNVFVDEVLRGTILFAISLCIKSLEPIVRKQAELPPWQLISWVPKVRGVLVPVKELTHLQEKVYEVPTILISDRVNGEEEIPNGVQGVLVRSASHAPDILSHISVRARNAHCLLAVCFNTDVINAWETTYKDSWVEIEVIMGGANLSIKPFTEPCVSCVPDGDTTSSGTEEVETATYKSGISRRFSATAKLTKHDSRSFSKIFDRKVTQSRLDEIECIKTFSRSISLQAPSIDFSEVSKSYYVTVDQFDRSTVGSKSLNLKVLKSKLDFILTPRAFALPYGSLNKVLNASENSDTILPDLKRILSNLAIDMDPSEVSDIFAKVHSVLSNLKMPQTCKKELETIWERVDALKGGIVQDSMRSLLESAGLEKSWAATCQVWASMFAMRPWISLAKANRSFMELNMAILVQELVSADYAFVLHTKNPFKEANADVDEPRQMYGELVTGLGEVLVANYPGRALSWIKNENEPAHLVAFPAKSLALMAKGSLIFRSDSNGEDLEGFAGAGLFESIPAISPERHTVSYASCPLITNHTQRQELIDRIGHIAFQIEDAFGRPMDIEGCVSNNRVVIVQARPQV